MKYNAINLIRRGADALDIRGDGGSAYALHELANNLLEVMEGRSTLEEWARCYTSARTDPVDLEKRFPASADGRAS